MSKVKKKNKGGAKEPLKVNQLVEIARSFTYKLNAGNYESRDFFCSQKVEVPARDADKVSEALYQWCKTQVIKSVNEYLETQIALEKEQQKLRIAQKNRDAREKEIIEDTLQDIALDEQTELEARAFKEESSSI